MRWRSLHVAVVVAIGVVTTASAQAGFLAQYHLGEAGSLGTSGNIPLDTVGTHDFLNNAPLGTPSVVDVTGGAPGSTKALNFLGVVSPNTYAQGYYFVDTQFIPTDNFRVELWAKTDNLTQSANFFASSAGGTTTPGALVIGVAAGNWIAGNYGVDYIGAAGGVGQPVAAGVWTKLAVQRRNGVSTFYINDVAQAGTSTNVPVNSAELLLGVEPGGMAGYIGALDELTISQIPEPATGILTIGGMIGLAVYAWRKSR